MDGTKEFTASASLQAPAAAAGFDVGARALNPGPHINAVSTLPIGSSLELLDFSKLLLILPWHQDKMLLVGAEQGALAVRSRTWAKDL